MGATTYRLMSGFAAEMPDDPGMAGLTALHKVVFSSTLEEPLSWANSASSRGTPSRPCAPGRTGARAP